MIIALLQYQNSFSASIVHSNYPKRNTTLPGYIECFIDYKTSNCDDCPPSCLSFNSSNIIVDNKILAKNIDKVFEDELKQISEVRSGADKNDSYVASIYLYSLLVKNQIKESELKLIIDLIDKIQTTDSLVSLDKTVKEKLNVLTSDNTSSPIAISIVNIVSKSIDLLIGGNNSIISTIKGYPNLMYDLPTQKKWLMEVLNNAIIGCDMSGITGCLSTSIASTGVP